MHVCSFARFAAADWVYTFRQEWSVPGQRHQLAVTVPVQGVENAGAFGDGALNYRFQAGWLEGRPGPLTAKRSSTSRIVFGCGEVRPDVHRSSLRPKASLPSTLMTFAGLR